MNKKEELLNSEKYEIYGKDRKEYCFNLHQEAIYATSIYNHKKWYRKIFGGKWRLLKLGKDTPYIGMFCHWTKLDDDSFSGYIEVLDSEEYEETGVDTKYKVFKQFLKNKLK